jgi:hypothetical protein
VSAVPTRGEVPGSDFRPLVCPHGRSCPRALCGGWRPFGAGFAPTSSGITHQGGGLGGLISEDTSRWESLRGLVRAVYHHQSPERQTAGSLRPGLPHQGNVIQHRGDLARCRLVKVEGRSGERRLLRTGTGDGGGGYPLVDYRMAGSAPLGSARPLRGTGPPDGRNRGASAGIRRFVFEGLGTPSPTAPTDRLVVGGLYRYVRNPKYVAVLVAM